MDGLFCIPSFAMVFTLFMKNAFIHGNLPVEWANFMVKQRLQTVPLLFID
jgi:hypothetical protein